MNRCHLLWELFYLTKELFSSWPRTEKTIIETSEASEYVKKMLFWLVLYYSYITIGKTLKSKNLFLSNYTLWHCGEVVMTITQLNSPRPELKLCRASNSACGVLKICDGENFWQQYQLEIHINAFCWSTVLKKTIYH